MESPGTILNLGPTPRRVKVYLLQGEDWLDNGTGYCVGEIDNESKAPYFLVRNELEAEDVILKSYLEGSIQYQRQQETLIVWTDLSGKDLALSFQETEGCADLCEFIIKMQQDNYSPNISLYYVIPSLTEGDDITELITGPITYPKDPTETNLEAVLDTINQGSNSQFTRTSISKFIIEKEYFLKLIGAFNKAESDKNLINLYTLSEIIKTLILYNESALIEDLLSSEERMLALVGILEYDPEYPNFKACHRDFLKNKSFKTVIPIEKLTIFKKDFHLNFLKDVVLARFLDDQTFNLLSSLIYVNQVEIINYLKDPEILEQLFNIYGDGEIINTNNELKCDGVRMLHQYVLIAKSLQSFQKSEFFSLLVRSGLFRMISFALNEPQSSIRVLGTELIVIIIEQDVSLVNSIDKDETIDNSEPPTQMEHHTEPLKLPDVDNTASDAKNLKLKLSDDMTLISILTRLLVEDKNPGLKIQAFEALRILLDSNIASNANPDIEIDQLKNELRSHRPVVASGSSDDFHDINTNNYFKAFYSQVAPELFNDFDSSINNSFEEISTRIRSDELLYQHLCELISFCTKEHDTSISRPFFLDNNILLGVGRLIAINCRIILKLSAIRCLKTLILSNDNYYCHYIIDSNLLRYFFSYFQLIADQNNLANSTCLDFIEIIVKNCDASSSIKYHNFKMLANYIYRNYKELCGTKLNHVSTGKDLIELVENGFYEDSNNHNNTTTDNTFRNEDISFGSDDEILDRHNASTPINDEEEFDQIEEAEGKNAPLPVNGNGGHIDLFAGTEFKSISNGEKRHREEDEEEEDEQRNYAKNGVHLNGTGNVIDCGNEESANNDLSPKKLSTSIKAKFSNASKKIALSLRSKNAGNNI
ncbi:component of IIS longevity pathway SMK-1-domain-containing protein [Scheffersomyces xylosifermentans]|uniref:component of IIS longevity pathway SMK-1-domain-containing protein n=1 Tax=Scheffersomyces xylosifermentans TaxID=1304137 RepID=UPI00315C5433